MLLEINLFTCFSPVDVAEVSNAYTGVDLPDIVEKNNINIIGNGVTRFGKKSITSCLNVSYPKAQFSLTSSPSCMMARRRFVVSMGHIHW